MTNRNPVKVFRQPCDAWIGNDYQGRTYGAWRIWCTVCSYYEWGGRTQAEALDHARRHCATRTREYAERMAGIV